MFVVSSYNSYISSVYIMLHACYLPMCSVSLLSSPGDSLPSIQLYRMALLHDSLYFNKTSIVYCINVQIITTIFSNAAITVLTNFRQRYLKAKFVYIVQVVSSLS